MPAPLAELLRPTTLSEVVGQPHLLGEGRVFRAICESGQLPNMIFYGPSGVGKTTVARIVAAATGKRLYKLNGTSASTGDIREIIARVGTLEGLGGIVLYLDEIQYLNKRQQQSLLEFIEDGSLTLIASTTENPYFYVYNAILSRSTVFEFKTLSSAEVREALKRALPRCRELFDFPFTVEAEALDYVASACGGDLRKAYNALEAMILAAGGSGGSLTLEAAREVAQRSAMRYDRDGDSHYDILSAFQKSVRGSDENAALHYLARLLTAGDLLSACRRLLVIAAEDVGLAYPQAIAITKSCVDAALQLGLPEARIPLAEAVILLCTAPKSNSAICAIDAAMQAVKEGKSGDIPANLMDGHYAGAQKLGRAKGYKYPHAYPGHYVLQQYLPDAIKHHVYYEFGENKTEQAALAYRQRQRAPSPKDGEPK